MKRGCINVKNFQPQRKISPADNIAVRYIKNIIDIDNKILIPFTIK